MARLKTSSFKALLDAMQPPKKAAETIEASRVAREEAQKVEQEQALRDMQERMQREAVDAAVPPGQEQDMLQDIDQTRQRISDDNRMAPIAPHKAMPGAQIDPETGAVYDTPRPEELTARTQERNANLEYLAQGQDADALLDFFARENDGFMAERRGVQTWKDTNEKADSIAKGKILNDLINRKKGDLFNAEQITRARQLMAENLLSLQTYAREITEGGRVPSEEQLYQLRMLESQQMAIQASVSGATAEIGRALGSMRQVVGPKNMAWTMRMKQVMEDAGGPNVMEAKAQLYANVEPDAIAKAIEATYLSKGLSGLYSWWINWSLLSGPITHMANIVGNTMAQAMAPLERKAGNMMSPIRKSMHKVAPNLVGGGDGIQTGEASAMLFGLLSGWSDSFTVASSMAKEGRYFSAASAAVGGKGGAAAADFFRTGDSAFGAGQKVDVGNMEGRSSMHHALEYLRDFGVGLPTRLLSTEDEFFKTTAYSMHMASLAWRDATAKGLAGMEHANHVAKLLADPPEEFYAEAVDFARYSTYTDELGAWGKSIQNFANLRVGGQVNNIRPFKMVLPFVRTPLKLVEWTVERGPLAAGNPNFWSDLAAGGARADMAMGRAMLGSIMWSMIVIAVMKGKITGAGPPNPKVNQAWRQSGAQNFTTMFGDEKYTYNAYNRLDPIGMQIGQVATAAEMYLLNDDPALQEEMAMAAVVGIAESLTSKQYMSGLVDFLAAINSRNTGIRENYISRNIATFGTTSLGNHIRLSVDEVRRETESNTFLGTLAMKAKNRVPGLSSSLPPMTDMWGEVVIYEALGPNWMSPIKTFQAVVDGPTTAVIENLVNPAEPACDFSVGNVKIDLHEIGDERGPGWACMEYRSAIGRSRHELMEQLIDTEGWRFAPTGPEPVYDPASNSLLESRGMMMRKVFAMGKQAGIDRIKELYGPETIPEIFKTEVESMPDEARQSKTPPHLRFRK